MHNEQTTVVWRKSTRSNGTGACVEVGRLGDKILTRDTKDRTGGTISFTRTDWTQFIDALGPDRN